MYGVSVYYAVQDDSVKLFSLWIKSYSLAIQSKATEQFLYAVLFIHYTVQGGSNF